LRELGSEEVATTTPEAGNGGEKDEDGAVPPIFLD
tara:strand:- start:1657 stop:1761 length:105 start_codon:yes stop_codon:yes gene_type:complete